MLLIHNLDIHILNMIDQDWTLLAFIQEHLYSGSCFVLHKVITANLGVASVVVLSIIIIVRMDFTVKCDQIILDERHLFSQNRLWPTKNRVDQIT